MKKHITLFLFFIILLKVSSQENRKFLYAEIKDKVSAVNNAHIINLNTKQGTFTNESGAFRILAKPNDSLQISFIGYTTKKIRVKQTHFGIQKNNILITKTPIVLDEVSLKNTNLLGYLSADVKNIKSKKEIDAKSLKLPYAGSRRLTPAERKLQTAMGGSTPFTIGLANSISLDYILNTFSGRIKKLKKLKAIEDLEFKINQVKNTYQLHIIKEFKIKESDLYSFLYYCETDKQFNTIFYAGDIEMIQFLKQKSIDFKKLNSKTYQ